MPPLPFRFVLSADSVDRLPDSPAEVAVVGRSNVGKSSLLNAIAGRHQLARTSKTPGRTQLLNCFALDGSGAPPATLVDCPGYGYAKVSKSARHAWAGMIERYLLEREPLVMVAAAFQSVELGTSQRGVSVGAAAGHTPLAQLVGMGLPAATSASASRRAASAAWNDRLRS